MADRLEIVRSGSKAAGEAAKRRPAVAILGFTDHKAQAPLGDPAWEVWGLNELYRYMPLDRFTRWFELHPRADFERPKEQGGDPDHITALRQFSIPVYMTEAHADIPASLALPKELIEARVSAYMTSTPAWMFGLALAEGFETIGLFGIDMAQDTEYAEQRPCMEYLCGIAHARGVQLVIPRQSDLLKAVAQYGYESQGSDLMLKFREREQWLRRAMADQEQRLANLEAEYKQKAGALTEQYQGLRTGFLSNIAQLKGALDNVVFFQRSWGVRPPSLPGVPVTPTAEQRAAQQGPRAPLALAPVPAAAAAEPAAGDGGKA